MPLVKGLEEVAGLVISLIEEIIGSPINPMAVSLMKEMISFPIEAGEAAATMATDGETYWATAFIIK